MKKIILIIFVLLILDLVASAQVRVYKGSSRYSSDVICKVKDGDLTIGEFVAVRYAVKYCY